MKLDGWIGLRWADVDKRYSREYKHEIKDKNLWKRKLGRSGKELPTINANVVFLSSFPTKQISEDLEEKYHPPSNHQQMHCSYPWAPHWCTDWSSLLSRNHWGDFHSPLWACHSQPGRLELFLLCIPRIQTATVSLYPRAPHESKETKSGAMQGPCVGRSLRWYHSWGCSCLLGPCWWGATCNETNPENQQSLLRAASLCRWTPGAVRQD